MKTKLIENKYLRKFVADLGVLSVKSKKKKEEEEIRILECLQAHMCLCFHFSRMNYCKITAYSINNFFFSSY